MANYTRICPTCGVQFETDNPRKIYTNKQCADRARNLPAIPPGFEGEVELRHFGKFPTDVKQRVLNGDTEHKIVFFDLECTSLKPNVGRILCSSFVTLDGEPYTFDALSRGFKKKDVFDDGALAKAIRDELEKYDVVVGHNSKWFDLKFLNSRLLRAGHRIKDAQYHIDTMWSWRSKSSAWSKLDSIQKFMSPDGETKTPVEWEQWMRALGWDKALREQAMAEIIDHCEKDVLVLRENFKLMANANVIRGLRLDGGVI